MFYQVGYISIRKEMRKLMTTEEVIEAIKRIEEDVTIEAKKLINSDMVDLPVYVKDLIYELEDMMMTNIEFFNYILSRLASLGYKHKKVNTSHERQIQIITSKGNLVLI